MPLSDVTEIEGCRNVKEPIKIPCFFSYCLYIVRVLLECDIIDMSPQKNKG